MIRLHMTEWAGGQNRPWLFPTSHCMGDYSTHSGKALLALSPHLNIATLYQHSGIKFQHMNWGNIQTTADKLYNWELLTKEERLFDRLSEATWPECIRDNELQLLPIQPP